MNYLSLIGRAAQLLDDDIVKASQALMKRYLIVAFAIGGAGSIGQAVTREIFKRDPKNTARGRYL